MPETVQAPYVDEASAALARRAPAPRRALLLDRDGVVNVDHGYVHTAAGTQWIDGIFDLVADAGRAGFLPIVITNQAGIARGFYGVDAFLAYAGWVHAQFRSRGAPLLATYYCPHHPEAGAGPWTRRCACRKPGTALIERAAADWRLDLGASVMLGDKASDVEAGTRAGVGRVLRVADARLPSFAQLLQG